MRPFSCDLWMFRIWRHSGERREEWDISGVYRVTAMNSEVRCRLVARDSEHDQWLNNLLDGTLSVMAGTLILHHAGKERQEHRCHDRGRDDCSLARAHSPTDPHRTTPMTTLWGQNRSCDLSDSHVRQPWWEGSEQWHAGSWIFLYSSVSRRHWDSRRWRLVLRKDGGLGKDYLVQWRKGVSGNNDNEVKHLNRVVRRTSRRRELLGVVQRCRDAYHRGWFTSLEQWQEDAGGGIPTSTPSHVSTTQLRIAQVSVWCFSFSFSVPGSPSWSELFLVIWRVIRVLRGYLSRRRNLLWLASVQVWKSAPRVELFSSKPVKTTPQMTRFRDGKVCNNWLQMKIDDHRMQSDYKCKSGLQHPEGKTLHLVLLLRGDDARQHVRHQWQRDHQDPEHHLHSAHEHWRVKWICAQFPSLSCSVFVTLDCTPHRGSSFTCARHLMVITWWAYLFDLESSIPFYVLIFSFILDLLHFLLHFFHYLEGRRNPAYFAWKEMDSLDDSYLLTGYEPKAYDLKETYVESYTESLTHPQFPEQRLLEDVDYDDTAPEDMLREAHRVHVYHSQREGLSVGQSSSSVSERTERPVVERTGRPVVERGQELNTEHAQIRTLLDRQREQILADCQAGIKKHEFQADYDRRRKQQLNETIESQQEELHRAQAEELQRRDQQLLHAQLLQQNWELREAHDKSLNEVEELKKFQNSTFDTIARRRLVEDQDTILELTGKIQELQNEINCMSDSRDFQDAESVRSGNSHVTSQPVSFSPHPIPGGMPSRREGPPSIWDTHGISGNVFANPAASSSAPYPQELNPWSSSTEEPLHSSTVEKSERQEQNQDLRCQSAQSAQNSFIFSGGDSSKNYGPDQQRLQISDLHFDKFPTPATFACWKIRFKTEVCTCSQFPTEAMLWIKEVEMVDSVDDLMSSSSIRGIQMPNFEVLDARIASALNRIIHN